MLPDYYEIIKEPIAFSTLRVGHHNLNSGLETITYLKTGQNH